MGTPLCTRPYCPQRYRKHRDIDHIEVILGTLNDDHLKRHGGDISFDMS